MQTSATVHSSRASAVDTCQASSDVKPPRYYSPSQNNKIVSTLNLPLVIIVIVLVAAVVMAAVVALAVSGNNDNDDNGNDNNNNNTLIGITLVFYLSTNENLSLRKLN